MQSNVSQSALTWNGSNHDNILFKSHNLADKYICYAAYNLIIWQRPDLLKQNKSISHLLHSNTMLIKGY